MPYNGSTVQATDIENNSIIFTCRVVSIRQCATNILYMAGWQIWIAKQELIICYLMFEWSTRWQTIKTPEKLTRLSGYKPLVSHEVYLASIFRIYYY